VVVSDTRLARELQQIPAIASLRTPDGRLDMERYKQLAASQGMTPEMFELQMRADISNRQVIQGVQTTAYATLSQTQTAINAFTQRREAQILNFPTSDYLSKVSLSDADLQNYYDKNAAKFQSAESADIEYVVLDIETIRQSVVVNDKDLKDYYEQNLQRLSSKEERRASHILIAAAKDAPEADKKTARAKAEELLKAVKAKPASFAEVARKNSQDPGSAVKGGDLDFFARGAMVKVFEDTAFKLNKSEISDVVESEFGFHIIQLTDIKAPKVASFESMRPALEADLKKQQAQRKFAELAEIFSNTVYEQSDSLKHVADKLKLSIQKASKVPSQPSATPATPATAKSPLTHPGLLKALFNEASLEKQRNTEAVEVAPNTLVSARVVKHQPAATLPFAEVKDVVKRNVSQDKAAEMAKAEGQKRLASLKSNAEGLPSAILISRDKTQKQAAQVVEAVLRADPNQLPAMSGIDLGAQGFAIVRVTKVLPPEENKELMKQAQQQFTQLWGSAETQAYMAELKSIMKGEILVPKPNAEKQKTPA
jgi:peptidyl-prolyl cis-trans isomerase D